MLMAGLMIANGLVNCQERRPDGVVGYLDEGNFNERRMQRIWKPAGAALEASKREGK